MTKADRDALTAAVTPGLSRLEAQTVETFADHNDLLARMMTLIEAHTARIERLEYHVLQIQPLPAMKTARKDH